MAMTTWTGLQDPFFNQMERAMDNAFSRVRLHARMHAAARCRPLRAGGGDQRYALAAPRRMPAGLPPPRRACRPSMHPRCPPLTRPPPRPRARRRLAAPAPCR
jgi:hypothetical protein